MGISRGEPNENWIEGGPIGPLGSHDVPFVRRRQATDGNWSRSGEDNRLEACSAARAVATN